jgi:hypothetical protein
MNFQQLLGMGTRFYPGAQEVFNKAETIWLNFPFS